MKRHFICMLMGVCGALSVSSTAQAQVGEPRRNICIGFTGGVAMNQIG